MMAFGFSPSFCVKRSCCALLGNSKETDCPNGVAEVVRLPAPELSRVRLRIFCLLQVALILSTAILSWNHASAADDAQANSEQQDARYRALVQQLGDEQFSVRERAMTQLIEIGVPARAALVEGRRQADREIRYRCERILSIVEELSFQRRLTAFASGKSDGHDLPGWERFRASFGDNADTRALFVQMQEAESELMKAVENGPQGVARAAEARCLALQQTQRSRGQPTSLGSLAALLFAVNEADANLGMQAASMMFALCRQPLVNNAMSDRSKGKILRKMVGSWIEKSEGWLAYQTLLLAMQYDLKEGLVPAEKILKNPAEQPFAKQQAILAVAKLGDKSYVDRLEPLLGDATRCSARRIKNVTYETQVRDVALAAILLLEGQDPKKFGFDRFQENPTTAFSTTTIGFANNDSRDKAFEKYHEFKKS